MIMAIYLIDECDQCGKSVPVHSSNLKRSSLVVEFDAARNWAGDQ